ncbi:MAG: hypothetical protein GXN99_02040, partial [Candidatus Nanohaloarchaeota archaeon]|nr:hypothetical protein [Candidatus Nanohaloarchaeota archaeon]
MEDILEKIMKKKKLSPKAINALKAKYQILKNQYYDIKGYREPVKNIKLDELIKGIYKDRDLSNLDLSTSYLENYTFINCK